MSSGCSFEGHSPFILAVSNTSYIKTCYIYVTFVHTYVFLSVLLLKNHDISFDTEKLKNIRYCPNILLHISLVFVDLVHFCPVVIQMSPCCKCLFTILTTIIWGVVIPVFPQTSCRRTSFSTVMFPLTFSSSSMSVFSLCSSVFSWLWCPILCLIRCWFL